MTARAELSLVVPAYREEAFIGASLETIAAYLRREGLLETTEVVVVTAHSPDQTAAITEEKAALFSSFQHIEPGEKVGKGRDVAAGVRAATGDYIIFTDADLATPVHHIASALQQLRGGADIVIGVRDLDTMHKTWLRRASSKLSNWLIRLLVLPGAHDTQCGFKGFSRQAAQTLFDRLTITGWGFDIELLAIARIHRLRVGELPIDDWHDPKDTGLAGDSQLSAMLSTFRELWRVRVNAWRGRYK